jgi:Calcineurin-like phosphoesterase
MRLGIAAAVVALAVGSAALGTIDGPPQTETVLAAGDIATCTGAGDEATAKIVQREPGLVLAVGDLVDRPGTASEFTRCYGPTWGRFRSRTRPVPGTNEYLARDAAPYRDYFGLRRTYSAFDLGTWRLYALDSEDVSPAQVDWLRNDLARHPKRCILAYWHRPRFSSGVHGDSPRVRPFWRLLFAAGADIVLNGRDHDYERFSRLDAAGDWEWFHGIREFVVGTGGQPLQRDKGTSYTTRAIQWWTHGVLRLRLGDRGYSWSYRATDGAFQDYGGEACR